MCFRCRLFFEFRLLMPKYAATRTATTATPTRASLRSSRDHRWRRRGRRRLLWGWLCRTRPLLTVLVAELLVAFGVGMPAGAGCGHCDAFQWWCGRADYLRCSEQAAPVPLATIWLVNSGGNPSYSGSWAASYGLLPTSRRSHMESARPSASCSDTGVGRSMHTSR